MSDRRCNAWREFENVRVYCDKPDHHEGAHSGLRWDQRHQWYHVKRRRRITKEEQG